MSLGNAMDGSQIKPAAAGVATDVAVGRFIRNHSPWLFMSMVALPGTFADSACACV